ncbi:unnamed protein product [Tetraodon nigroviridis]|uniref:(spotted green pufferfish) hypothetical protein n=1 Tax=Tetraodon nigroviridis TaxID=99883 RepID=Q4TD45_TETNG|nr:unnamed protein product [Tetraodon nigroviridis]
MALSSGGWAPPAAVPASSQQASCGGPIPTACCSTVLMSVRVSVCHSGIRPLCLPGAGSEALRLQLSMDPSRAGEFRLALRDMSGHRSVFIAEFDLRSVQYEVKSPRCHEMRLSAPPHDSISFNFRCDREAEEWATVVMSSLREAHRGLRRRTPSTKLGSRDDIYIFICAILFLSDSCKHYHMRIRRQSRPCAGGCSCCGGRRVELALAATHR